VSVFRRLVPGLFLVVAVVLGLVSPASADQAKSVFTTNVSQVTGALVDPNGRTWVADRVAGFCRVSEPASTTSPGTVETSTCLGGTGPGAGPAKPGAPAFVDPTPGSVGSGDEMALLPDSAQGSADLVRARWNSGSKLFLYHSVLQLHDGDLRPRAVSVGSDRDAYVIFERARSILRIEDPTVSQPIVNVVAYATANGPLAIAASEVRSGASRITVYVAESSGLRSFVPPSSTNRSSQTPASSYNVGAVTALLYDPQTDLLYAGTGAASATGQDVVKQVNTTSGAIDAAWASGYTRITGLGLRNGKLMVADDAGLLTNPAPVGTGKLYLLAPAVVRIVSGPTAADGTLAPNPALTNDSTPTFTVASEPAGAMQCSLRPTGQAAVWTDCTGGTFTQAPALADGPYTFGVRSGTDGVPATQNFTIDTVAPAAPAVGTPSEGQVIGTQIILDALGDAGTTLKCAIDSTADAAYQTCQSGDTLTFAGEGAHVLRVKAYDAAGNVSPITVRNVVVDITAPNVTVTSPAADGAVVEKNTSIEFSSTSPDVTGFECKIDAGNFVPCTSPKGYVGLSEGAHTFQVRATDAAGNTATATRNFSVADLTPPVITATPPGGEYTSGTTVALASNEANTTIRFTTDGTEPTVASPAYTAPIPITSDFTLKYIGTDAAGNTSTVASQVYTVDVTPPVVTPNPPAGPIAAGSAVTLTSNEANTTIRFTTNGDTPTTSSPVYTAPIVVTTDVTIRFIGIDAGGNTSAPASAAYTAFDGTAPILSTSPVPGTYPSGRLISLLSNEPNTTIRFTTNGSNPTGSSPVYSAPIALTADMTIKAIGTDAAGNTSTVASFVFKVGQTFADVAPGAAFYDEIDWLYAEGITTGVVGPNGTLIFGPQDSITREAMAAFLYRFMRQPAFTPPATSPFNDLTPTSAFYKEITWLVAEGIQPAGGNFSPTLPVTREQQALWMFRAVLTGAEEAAYVPSGTEPFTDVEPSHPSYKEISWMWDAQLSTGANIGGQIVYAPADPISREAMAAFFFRADDKGFRP